MSTPRIEDTLLQRLFDDDLTSAEHDDVAALLDASAVDRGRLEALERLSGFVGDVVTEDAAQLSAADSMSMFDAVLLGIEKVVDSGTTSDADAPAVADEGSAPRKRPKLRLIEGEGLGTLPPRSEKVAFEPKLRPDTVTPKPVVVPTKPVEAQGVGWPAIAAVVALAAAAVLAIALRPDTRVGPADPGSVAVVVEPHADPEVVVAEDPEVIVASHLGTEVEEVDFGSNIGTVFQVPGEQDVPVAVVWISDEEFVR